MKRITNITYSGPFFHKDPAKTLQQNIETMLDAVGREGEQDVKAQIAGHRSEMPAYTGWTYDSVRGAMRSLSGKPWRRTVAIQAQTGSMNDANAIRTKAAASTIEGRWHPFRKTLSRLRRARAINRAELTKGLT